MPAATRILLFQETFKLKLKFPVTYHKIQLAFGKRSVIYVYVWGWCEGTRLFPFIAEMMSDDVRWWMFQAELIWRSHKVGTVNNDPRKDVTPITAIDNSIIFVMASQQDILSQSSLTVHLCQRWIQLCLWPLKSSQSYSELGSWVCHESIQTVSSHYQSETQGRVVTNA